MWVLGDIKRDSMRGRRTKEEVETGWNMVKKRDMLVQANHLPLSPDSAPQKWIGNTQGKALRRAEKVLIGSIISQSFTRHLWRSLCRSVTFKTIALEKICAFIFKNLRTAFWGW